MLASAAHTLHTDDATDLPQAHANAILRVAFGFEGFVSSVIADNAEALRTGAVVVNALENVNGRETGDRMKLIPTDARIADYAPIMSQLRTLAILAARIAKLESCDNDMPKVISRMSALMARMSNVDSTLWDVFAATGKSHLSGPDASILETSGFAWTSSRKGHATTIRYDEKAQTFTRSHKGSHAYAAQGAYLSERDMI